MGNTQKPTNVTVQWNINFGQSKEYYLFLAKSNKSVFAFVQQLHKILDCNFAFVNFYKPDEKQPMIKYPMFFSSFSHNREEKIVVMPNSVPVENNIMPEEYDPLNSMFLFQDDYYIFNKQGQRFVTCPFVDYDFLILIYSGKNHNITDVIREIQQEKSIILQDVSDYMSVNPKAKKSEEMNRIKILQALGVSSEVHINNFENDCIAKLLGPCREAFDKAYNVKYPGKKPYVENELLYREDI